MSRLEEVSFRDFQNMVLEYAVDNGYFPSPEEIDLNLETEFLLKLYSRGLFPRSGAVDVDEAITDKRILFLNWLLLEREYMEGKTIAELYLKSGAFREMYGEPTAELKEEVRNLRHPLCGVFVVDERRPEGDGYLAHPLDGDDALFIHDATLEVEVGAALHGLLYRFGERYYIGDKVMVRVPDKFVRRYHRSRALMDLLEDEFEGFMETKRGLSDRTLMEKEEMFEGLLDYVEEKMYTKMDQIIRMNVDTWMRWMRRRYLFFSRSSEEAYRRGFRQFLRHLSRENTKRRTAQHLQGRV